jgi:hypothetical protein
MLSITRFEMPEERRWSPFEMDVPARSVDTELIAPPADAYRLERER